MIHIFKKINLRNITDRSLFMAVFLFSPSFSMDTGYSLPGEVDSQTLTKSAVFVRCADASSTGFAVGSKHILTAAHAISGVTLGAKIECVALESVQDSYVVPVKEAGINQENEPRFIPDFSQGKNLRILDIVRFHFPTATSIQQAEQAAQGLSYKDMMDKLETALRFDLDAVISSYGVSTTAIMQDNNGLAMDHKFRVFGPDIAILECSESHGLPTLEIADPIEERSLLHIVGLSGWRYRNNDSSCVDAGGILSVNGEPILVYKPAIYSQRFQCLPASDDGQYAWVNRVFLQVKDEKFFMDDQVLPKTPKGFGLIAHCDSGSGVVAIIKGQAFLTGIVSWGNIEPIFIIIHNLLCDFRCAAWRTENPEVVAGLTLIYKTALQEQERDKRWFITQVLADLTHFKDWVSSIVNDT